MKEKEIVYSLDTIDLVVDYLRDRMKDCAVFTFTGELGTGKTTLVKAFLKSCGVVQAVTSPTFTYVNIYENQHGQTFYHFDLYRIKMVDDFIAAGFNEYLYQPNSWSLIEWPEVIVPLLDAKVCHSILDYDADQRKIYSTSDISISI